jgi:hypothetical protein
MVLIPAPFLSMVRREKTGKKEAVVPCTNEVLELGAVARM